MLNLHSGTFINQTCDVYEPVAKSASGKHRVVQIFSTENPYRNGQDRHLNMTCPETIQMKFDKSIHFIPVQDQIILYLERGFNVERKYDWLEIRTETMKNKFDGDIGQLPSDFRSGEWFDTKSKYVSLWFHSDSVFERSGFRFYLSCQNQTSFTIKQAMLKI